MISDAIRMLLRPQDFQLVNRGTDTHAGSTAKECTLDPCSSPSQRTFIVFKNCCITKDSHKRVRKATLVSLPFPFYQVKKKKIQPSDHSCWNAWLDCDCYLDYSCLAHLKLHNIVLNLPEDNLKITYNFQHQFRFFDIEFR